MDVSESFWGASLEQLKAGYRFDDETDSYLCLVCGEPFEEGRIYPHEDALYEAKRMVKRHVDGSHGSMLGHLLSLGKKATGLTELQKELIDLFAAGVTDAEIVKRTGAGSASTIRNHRFALKEKAKQAKLFLAVMELLEEGSGDPGRGLMPVPRTATQVDERYVMTADEYETIIKRYFPEGLEGELKEFPRREKRKIAVLRYMTGAFESGRRYTEKEVSKRLKRFYPDFVTLRRYLIEYGFMDREPDGSAYWIKA